jgi:hypothetical protein
MDKVVEGKTIAFPTIVLSAKELLAVYRGDGRSDGAAGIQQRR